MPGRYLNLSAYRFVALCELPALREQVHATAQAFGVKGTVILAEEGINLFVAAAADAARAWLARLGELDPRLAGLDAKQSWSETLPYRRLQVKIKREIIRMNQPQVRPAAGRAATVDAATLAHWLDRGSDDQGRELVMLDARNAFEVEAGAFVRATDWRLAKFSDFPAAIERHKDALAGRTVVTYCTGGIRCEKAALALRAAGVETALQLEGGILRYLEQVSGARHWRGRCFVFDERGALDAALRPQ